MLDAVAAGGVAGRLLTDIARAASLGEPTTLRYRQLLGSHDLVTRDPDTGRYALGLRLFRRLGQQAVGIRDVRKLALPHMERLLERYEETVNLAARRRDRLVVVEVLESTRSIRRGATVGEPDYWTPPPRSARPSSWVLPEGDARAVLERSERPRFTPRTLTDIDELVEELREVRERGYSIDDEEFEDGLRCVGGAIADLHGRPAFGLSISGLAARMSLATTHQMGRDVLEAASTISTQLGFVPSGEGGT